LALHLRRMSILPATAPLAHPGSLPLSPQPLESDLRLLFAINQILVGSLEPLSVLEPVLAALVEGTHLQHAVVAMVHRASGELRIEAAVGLTADEQRAAEERVDASPIAEAVALSQPMTLPLKKGDHPLLGVCSQPEPCSLLVIPIQLSGEIVGAIAGDFPSTPHSELNHVSMLMSTVASMIAQAVRLRQRAAEERDSLRAENERLRDALKERYRPENIVGDSKPMLTVFDQIARVCRADATVLIRGESGVGKELVAAAIHYSSDRATKPFIKVNCAALPATLLESELFGHEKGAFTGAIQERIGRFELADGGTLFLDEIGDMSAEMQKKLLRVLQEGEFRVLGSDRTVKVDVRILTASHRNLEEMVREGTFREDLFYRVAVLSVDLPALRDRRDDIPLLAEHLLLRAAREAGREVPTLPHDVVSVLCSHDWPGNVRELENEMRRLLVVADDQIRVEHLSKSVVEGYGRQSSPAAAGAILESGDIRSAVADLECRSIEAALAQAGDNKSKAASALGISRFALQRKLDKYGIGKTRRRGGTKGASGVDQTDGDDA